MKFANKKSNNPKKINDIIVAEEYKKINNSVATHLKGTDFVCVILCRCDGNYDPQKLPSKCVVVTRKELEIFYGEPYFHRLDLNP